MAKKFMETKLPNGITVSTVKIGKVYETAVLDMDYNDLRILTATRQHDARSNHMMMIAHYVISRNTIHAIA